MFYLLLREDIVGLDPFFVYITQVSVQAPALEI